MTDDQWPQELHDFYQDLSLSDASRESIAQVQDAVLESRKWKSIAGALTAACVALLVLGAFLVVNQGGKPKIVDNHDVEPKDNTNETPVINYDVMAVYIHRDWCGKCKEMGDVFAELKHDLSGRRVLFLTFDLTDPVTTKQSQLLGDQLKISRALKGIESGKIVLLNRNGQRLETLDGLSGREYLADQIAMRL